MRPPKAQAPAVAGGNVVDAQEHDAALPLLHRKSGLIRRQGVIDRLAQRAERVRIRQDQHPCKRQGAVSGGGLDAVADNLKWSEHKRFKATASGPRRTRAPGRKPTVKKPHQGKMPQGLMRRTVKVCQDLPDARWRRRIYSQAILLLQWLNHATGRSIRQAGSGKNQAALECCATRASTTSRIFCC